MARTPTLLGRARLERKLRALSTNIKAPIRMAIAASAEQIVLMAKSLVPVDSGALRDSIGWTWGRPPGGTVVLAATQALGAQLTATIYAGSDKAYQARWIEFGTVKMAAQPYFFPSYRAHKKTAKARIRKALRDTARSVAKS